MVFFIKKCPDSDCREIYIGSGETPMKNAIIFLLFIMFPRKVNSPEVKRNLETIIIKLVYGLTHKCPTELRL